MTVTRQSLRLTALLLAVAPATLAVSWASDRDHSFGDRQGASVSSRSGGGRYTARFLVSDGGMPAEQTDADLVNPWGLAFNPNGPVWIADNHTGVSTLEDGDGVKQSLVVTIPSPGGDSPGAPTGIVFNSSGDFVVHDGDKSGPARFLFATEDGTIAGWSPDVSASSAILMVDRSEAGAIYKGLALAGNGSGHFLYATDFHNGRIDVFDANFAEATLPGSFSDPRIPSGFAPFGIANIGGDLYVTYAKQDADREDDVSGPGLGFVDEFDANGNLLRRVATRGKLNAPWGMALAPGDFGQFANDLLIGNFGDGTIQAYDLSSGEHRGVLRGTDNRPLAIDGLWGIAFGNGVRDQPTHTLFFAAGPDDESHGVYGRIDPVLSPGF